MRKNISVYQRVQHEKSVNKLIYQELSLYVVEKAVLREKEPPHSSLSMTTAVGGGSNATASFDDLLFSSDSISLSTQLRKDEAMLVLKSDLMAALDKEVKSLDECNWKFEGPRSRIHLIPRRDDCYCATTSGGT
ncbi:hypothetical protein Lalb_Chr16g0381181 [Lupinus albus]|uniref:Uncharacterized protein n=1 Tax=Lupinus albus TaxID=3870 RepID=A0A6A4NTG1_LUPAL|nr:hypothetical protein Lalb_Chr16g0381181 [Lupinus albus]